MEKRIEGEEEKVKNFEEDASWNYLLKAGFNHEEIVKLNKELTHEEFRLRHIRLDSGQMKTYCPAGITNETVARVKLLRKEKEAKFKHRHAAIIGGRGDPSDLRPK